MQIGMSARNRCIRWRALAPPGAIATECSVRGGDATLCQITLDTCYQARRQETKWQGVFFVKKVDLSSTQGALCTVSVFFILHFAYLGGWCVRTRPTGLVVILIAW